MKPSIGIIILTIIWTITFALVGSTISMLTTSEPECIRTIIQEELQSYHETNQLMQEWLTEWSVLTEEEWRLSEESSIWGEAE